MSRAGQGRVLSPVGAENSIRSCVLQIPVEETADPLSPQRSNGCLGGQVQLPHQPAYNSSPTCSPVRMSFLAGVLGAMEVIRQLVAEGGR